MLLHLITKLLILLAVSGMKLIIPGEGMSWKKQKEKYAAYGI